MSSALDWKNLFLESLQPVEAAMLTAHLIYLHGGDIEQQKVATNFYTVLVVYLLLPIKCSSHVQL